MSKVLILLTHCFPYNPPTEQFLYAELGFLSKKFDRIVLIPTSRMKPKEHLYSLDFKNVEYAKLNRKSKFEEFSLGFITNALFRLSFWRECFSILFGPSNGRKRKMLLLFDGFIKNGGLMSQIKKVLKKDFEIQKNDELLIYSYWFNSNAILNVMLKQYLVRNKWSCVKSVSRAHGLGDLYLEYRPRISYLNRNLDGVYAISSGGFDFLAKSGIKRKLLAIYRLGVAQRNVDLSIRNEVVEIVSCSMLTENKRVYKIIDGLSQITGFQIKWTHFGTGELLNDLIEECKTKLPKNIEWYFRGNVSNESILDYYCKNAPKCFINVSSIEGIPVSIMEAFSCGIPAIATDVGATSEIVEDGRTGFLIDKNFTSKKLADSIIKICLSEETYSRLKTNAYEKWKTMYNSTDNYLLFCDKCLKVLDE